MPIHLLLLAWILCHCAEGLQGLEEQCQMRTVPQAARLIEIGQQRRALSTIVLSALSEENMGVANQHSALLSLLVLAVAARIHRVLLPPSLSRSNWTAPAEWRAGPASELWDLQSVSDFLASGNVKLQGWDSSESAAYVEPPSLKRKH